jgi:two-component system, sensor histidine kinase
MTFPSSRTTIESLVPAADYALVFNAIPGAFLILLPDSGFTIVGVSEEYLRATLTCRDQILGRSIFDVFPDNPLTPEANSTQNLARSLQRVVAIHANDVMAVQRYDVPRPDGHGFDLRYWFPVNAPVLAEDGTLKYIVHRVDNVTQYVLLGEENARERTASAQLSAENLRMEAEIVERTQELDRLNFELRRANEELSEHMRRVQEEGTRKDEFLAMLSHELRNPLAPISTAAEMLRMVSDGDATVSKASEVITRQVKHLSALVDDLLDVSRVTRGFVQLNKEVVDLNAIVDTAVEQSRPLMESRKHSLTVHHKGVHLFLIGDRNRLVQVVANLLNNAAKYTPEAGAITVTVHNNSSDAFVEVEDNGVGIDVGFLPRMFDLFTQAKRTPDRSQGGLGIGLSLVKSIVKLHGGEITVTSGGPGTGAKFTVSLPLPPKIQTKPKN